MNRAQKRAFRKGLAVPKGWQRRQIRIPDNPEKPPPSYGDLLVARYEAHTAGQAQEESE